MAATLSTNLDVIAKLAPGGAQSLAQLSDDELLANTRRLVGKTNQLLAALLAHLAEVETRAPIGRVVVPASTLTASTSCVFQKTPPHVARPRPDSRKGFRRYSTPSRRASSTSRDS